MMNQDPNLENPALIPSVAVQPGPIEIQKSKIKNQTRQLRGRIARLPADVRRQINQMLDDHLTSAEILKSLADQGHGKGLTIKCIKGWRARGYRDYRRHQDLIAQCRARTDRAFELALKSENVRGFQATQQIASAQILEIMTDVGTDVLRDAVLSNPLNYFRMLSAFTRISNSSLRCERHLAEQSERQAKEAAAAASPGPQPKKGLSPSTLQTLNQDLNLM